MYDKVEQAITNLTQLGYVPQKLSSNHLRIGEFDYWPTTGLAINMTTKGRTQGEGKLISALRNWYLVKPLVPAGYYPQDQIKEAILDVLSEQCFMFKKRREGLAQEVLFLLSRRGGGKWKPKS